MSNVKRVIRGPTEIWTRIAGFKVQSANHYTMGPSMAEGRLFEYRSVGLTKSLVKSKWNPGCRPRIRTMRLFEDRMQRSIAYLRWHNRINEEREITFGHTHLLSVDAWIYLRWKTFHPWPHMDNLRDSFDDCDCFSWPGKGSLILSIALIAIQAMISICLFL